jgi:2-oxoglutarate dehydrogenase E1 component
MLESYRFTEEELRERVPCENFAGREGMTLSDLITEVLSVYSESIGYEYWHISNDEEREWLRSRIEGGVAKRTPLRDDAVMRLKRLIEADRFEGNLHRKYVGAKRFSLEGLETLLPILGTLLDGAPQVDIRDVVIGMAHRGRLNVLANICGKPLVDILLEFNDRTESSLIGDGDVKYHNGFLGKHRTNKGRDLGIWLSRNPSHLEFVTPVIMGISRALSDLRHKRNRVSVLPIAIHGDAAFIGQGVVTETLNFSNIKGFSAGGAIHIVTNNQLGFTTEAEESRSSSYCTDFARALEIPIFHVNSEDIDGSCEVTKLALEYRARFKKDVVIDLIGYRKYGHNEGDDPTFTQPLLYAAIKQKKPLLEQYTHRVNESGLIPPSESKRLLEEYEGWFDAQFKRATSLRIDPKKVEGLCSVFGRIGASSKAPKIDREVLLDIAKKLVTYPEDFRPHPKLAKILAKRSESVIKNEGSDWGICEALAYGTLLREGISIRLTGQDSIRGTFSHRHLGLDHYVEEPGSSGEGSMFYPLSNVVTPNGARFEVYNSSLSEAGVMGFEYGYSVANPNTLVLWEAQFGDFANGAQVILDQFLFASETKWNEVSGLVLLLPHGYEGQGPEHSSARMERFLQACAQNNISVCNPTNGAQIFNLLRRQAYLEVKRPLVIFTPKSLLRLPEASSKIDDLLKGNFSTILETDLTVKRGGEGSKVKEVIICCSGKIYYELLSALSRDLPQRIGIRILRFEQLYPFPELELEAVFKERLPSEIFWVQEEPKNMGAWSFMLQNFTEFLSSKGITLPVTFFGRQASSSTATGSPSYHLKEQQEILTSMIEKLKA